jgi:hypothetical protein
MDKTPFYEKWAENWEPRLCPKCGSKTATAYGQVFREPAPRLPEIDTRKPIDELWLHDDGTQCSRVSN